MQPPKKNPPLPELLTSASREAADLCGLVFADEDAPALRLGMIDLKDCTFTGCHLTDCRFDRTGFQNVVFDRCDLSGCRFFECGMKQVIFRDCRLMGAVLTDCTLAELTVRDCSARYLQLSGGTVKRSAVAGSGFLGGAFLGVHLKKTTLTDCDLTRCDFRGTDQDGLDLSTCTIPGCTWSPDKLKNLTVSMDQAVELSRLLGLRLNTD